MLIGGAVLQRGLILLSSLAMSAETCRAVAGPHGMTQHTCGVAAGSGMMREATVVGARSDEHGKGAAVQVGTHSRCQRAVDGPVPLLDKPASSPSAFR